MGYVSFSQEKPSINEKQQLARRLERIGITDKNAQIKLMSELLGKDNFDPATMSRQQCYDISYKLTAYKAEKESQ